MTSVTGVAVVTGMAGMTVMIAQKMIAIFGHEIGKNQRTFLQITRYTFIMRNGSLCPP